MKTHARQFSLATLMLCVICLVPDSAYSASGEDEAPVWPREIRQRNAEMKRRVDAWLERGRSARMPLHVIYLTCSDQSPFPEHRERLNRVLTEIQDWFASQHEAAGFGRTTFGLERDADGLVKLHEGALPFEVGSRTRNNLLNHTRHECVKIARALLSKVDVNYDRSFVLILTTIPDDHGAAPFFGNIIQDRGYCYAVDTPWLDSKYTQTAGEKVWKGKPVGPANSALIGGIAHELGHGFGLPHCDEPASQQRYGESLMGRGNYTWRQERRLEGRGSFLLDTDAMFLMARPPFTGRVRDLGKQPRARIDGLQFEQMADGRIRVTGRVESDIPAHAVKVYDDPPESNDYNAVAHVALPDESTGAFTMTFRPIRPDGKRDFRVYLYHVNGRWTRQKTTVDLTK